MRFSFAFPFELPAAKRFAALLGIAAVFIWSPAIKEARAQDILIVRPLENNKTDVFRRVLKFEVRVSAFSPVTRVRINGEAQSIQPANTLQVKKSLRLKPGENNILVQVDSKDGSASRNFVVNYHPKGKRKPKPAKKQTEKKKDPFQLISVLGVEYSTNAQKAAEGLTETSGTRFFLVLIPRYDWFPSNTDTLRLQSVISRDKFAEAELEAEEISFTQLTFSWIQEFSKNSFWTIGAGYDGVYQAYDSLIQGQTKKQNDTSLFTTIRLALHEKTAFVEFGLDLKDQQQVEEAEDQDKDEDTAFTTLNFLLQGGLFGLKSRTKASYSDADADGKLKDKTVSRLAEELSIPFGSFIFGFGFRAQQSKFAEPDPDFEDVAPKETLLGYFVSGIYAFSSSWILIGEVATETQSSNVPSSEYDNDVLTTSIIYIF